MKLSTSCVDVGDAIGCEAGAGVTGSTGAAGVGAGGGGGGDVGTGAVGLGAGAAGPELVEAKGPELVEAAGPELVEGEGEGASGFGGGAAGVGAGAGGVAGAGTGPPAGVVTGVFAANAFTSTPLAINSAISLSAKAFSSGLVLSTAGACCTFLSLSSAIHHPTFSLTHFFPPRRLQQNHYLQSTTLMRSPFCIDLQKH